MAKLKAGAIAEADLIEYLDTTSDFAFEQEILGTLLEMGFDAQHGGTYADPSTGIPREFDLRASKWVHDRWKKNITMQLRVAVECKNISESFPLLVECVPRTRAERFHEFVISLHTTSSRENWHRGRVTTDSIYRESQPVGKTCCQVGRTTGNDLSSSDSGVYTKWAQALASIFDLFQLSKTNRATNQYPLWTALIPFLVVPDDRLWMIEYDDRGNRRSDPRKTDHVSYWVNKPLSDARNTDGPLHWFSVSHIEFCTKSGLSRIIREYLENPSDHLFSADV